MMKLLIIREAFRLRLLLMMMLNNENPFQTTAKTSSQYHIWDSPYFYISIDCPIYLPTTKFFVQIFFGKSMADPTYLQFGHMSKVL